MTGQEGDLPFTSNTESEERVPPVLQGSRLKPFISNELLEKSQPIVFRTPEGVRARRSEIAKKAAEARWKKQKGDS